MRFLKTNTAVIVSVSPFYDKTDGVTIETGLTITNEKITAIKDLDDGNAPTLILDNATGAASGTDNDLNYITDNDAGMMQLEFTASNLNFLGRLFLTITDAANHVPVFHEFMVISASAWDFMFGSGNVPADVLAVSGDSTAADNLELMFDGTGYAGGTAKLGVDVVKIGGVVAAAVNLAASAGTIHIGSVTGAATTITLIDSTLTQADADFWKGRILIFTSGANTKQATDITAFDPATDKLTFSSLTSAPSGGDTYVIV